MNLSFLGEVSLDGKIVQISAGDSHSAALTSEGKVYYWGTFRDNSGTFGLTPDANPIGSSSESQEDRIGYVQSTNTFFTFKTWTTAIPCNGIIACFLLQWDLNHRYPVR